jgi:hypothetical protein
MWAVCPSPTVYSLSQYGFVDIYCTHWIIIQDYFILLLHLRTLGTLLVRSYVPLA